MNQQLLQNAWRLCQTGNTAGAARLCHEVLHSDPDQIGALHMLGIIHSQRAEFTAAEPFLTKAVKLAPASPVILLHRGNVLFELRRFAEALADYDAALAREPRNAVIWNNRGNALAALGQNQQAIESFGRALAIDPRHLDALVSRADLYSACGRDQEALRDLEKGQAVSPGPELHYRRAALLLRNHDSAAALRAFDQALALAQEPDFHIGRSMALVALKRNEDALAALDAALALAPQNLVALGNRSSVLSRLKRYGDALNCADRGLKLAPDSAAGWHNRGTALAGLRNTKAALEAYDKALALDPQNAQTWNNAGAALIFLDHNEAAIGRFDRALELNPSDAETWSNRARALANLNRFPEALHDAEIALKHDPAHVGALRMAIHARLRSCDWSRRAHDIHEAQSALRAGRRVLDPLHCLAMFNSGADNLAAARLWTEEECLPQKPAFAGRARGRHDRMRIAYLSTDLRDHAVGFLIAGVIEHHDRSRFEVTALSAGPDDGSATRARMQTAFERFIDVREMPDFEAAQMIRDLEIDILVDLNGYTGNQRTGIIAFRPAPVQVNYLGYPGTMGSPLIDWIIADPVLIPEAQREFYSEKIVRLPDCYQPNDRRRTVAEHCPSRAEAGLPEFRFPILLLQQQLQDRAGYLRHLDAVAARDTG